MTTRAPIRWLPILVAAVALALIIWAVATRNSAPAGFEVPAGPGTGPAPTSAWSNPANPLPAVAPATPGTEPAPHKPTDPPKKKLTQEEIASGKW